jgi:hypothetical protein
MLEANEFNGITMLDIESAIKSARNRKAAIIDYIRIELCKYSSRTMKMSRFNYLWYVELWRNT